MKNLLKGFTLVELLIVIALLGALAVGLLAALDPFEQLKKGDDTGIRNTVSEIHGAVIRHYAVTGVMPWSSYTYTDGKLSLRDVGGTNFSSAGLQYVVSSGELKRDFSTLAGNKLSQIYMDGTTESVTVCFKPMSKSFRSDMNTKYRTDLSGGGAFLEDTSRNCGDTSLPSFSCFWCIK